MINNLKELIKTKWHAWLHKNIARGLTRVYQQPGDPLPAIDLSAPHQPKYIIFSDQHRGARNGADDFQRSERAYNAALAYYFEMGYRLIALGDVEELWEERPGSVLTHYAHSLSLEAKFFEHGRYYRVFGNHDDIWQYPDEVDKHLLSVFGLNPPAVHEGLKIPVQDGSHSVGEFFLAHGHQGSLESDYLTDFSRFWVRNLWRTVQRITKLRLNTPASDWKLRKTTNIAMHDWASQQDNLVLITGHTHYPVFKSQTHEDQLVGQMTAVRADTTLNRLQKQARIADLAARLEWVRASQGPSSIGHNGEIIRPCYFNSGCCSYADGDITGLEIADGQIRLVRWPGEESHALPKVLAAEALAQLFPAVKPERMRHSPENGLQAMPVPVGT